MRAALVRSTIVVLATLALVPPAEAWLRRGAQSAPEALSGAWARPLHGGPLRVLLIAPTEALRDGVELARRLDVTLHAFAVDAAEDPALENQARGSWDVVVLGGCDPDTVPLWLQERVVALAGSGTGLLLAYLDTPSRPLSERGPLARWLGGIAFTAETAPILRGVAEGPGWGDLSEVVQAAEAGGRVVWLDYPGDRPRTQVLTPPPADPLAKFPGHTENAWSLVARALCWSAGRLPETALAGIADLSPAGPDAEEIPPDLPASFIEAVTSGSHTAQPARPFRVVMETAAARDYDVRFRVRPVGAPSLAETSLSPRERVAKGAIGYPVELFAGPGEYWIDVWLLNKDRVVDWHTSPMRLGGWPSIATLDAAKTFVLPNDHLALRATVPPVFSQGRICTVYARATDALGRVVAHRTATLASEGGEALLGLDLADLISPLLRVEVFAVEGAPRPFTELDLLGAHRRTLHFPVRLPWKPTSPVLALATDSLAEANAQSLLVDAAKAGAGVVAAPARLDSILHAPRTGLRLAPMPAPLAETDAWPCASAPGAEQRVARGLQESVLAVWAGGIGRHLLRTPPTDAWGADCESLVADALKRHFGELPALEAAWASRHADWAAAARHLLAEEDDRSPAAQVARHAITARMVAGHLAAWRNHIRAADPDALVGADAQTDPGGVLDFQARAINEDMPDGPPARHAAWTNLLSGDAWIWWNTDGLAALPITPEGSPTGDFAPLADWIDQVDDGMGALILAAHPVPAPIAGIQSAASDTFSRATGTRADLANRVAMAGHRIDALGENAIPSDSRTHKVLVLDHIAVLSDDALERIRAYHASGGALLIQGVPGSLDPMGRSRGFADAAAAVGGDATGAERVFLADGEDWTALARWIGEHSPEAPRAPGLQWRQYRFGRAELLSALAPPGGGGVSTPIQLEHRHAVDLISGKSGRRSISRARIDAGEAGAWASLPYRVKRIEAEMAESVVAGQRLDFLVQLQSDDLDAVLGDHLLVVDLESRDGLARRHYRQWIRATGGVAHGFIPLAINEAQGRHRVRVRDALSGAEAIFPVMLLPNFETP